MKEHYRWAKQKYLAFNGDNMQENNYDFFVSIITLLSPYMTSMMHGVGREDFV